MTLLRTIHVDRRPVHTLLAAAAGLFMLGQVASAATTTLGASQDAMIFGTSAGVDTRNASGKGPAMFAGADGQGNVKRSLVEFDLSAIPTGATITGVTLKLSLAQVAGSGGGAGGGGNLPTRIFSLYELQQGWAEGVSGSPTSPNVGGSGQGYARSNGDVTWDYASFNSDPAQAVKWNGGAVKGGFYASTASATTTITSFNVPNAQYSWSSAGLVGDVQSWIDGTSANNGWLLKSDNLETTSTSFLGFWSKDGAGANGQPGWAPSLTVDYEPAPPVPEPETWALLAAGLAVLTFLRRGRR